MSRIRSRARSAAKRTALPPMNVPRDANVPVHTAEESLIFALPKELRRDLKAASAG